MGSVAQITIDNGKRISDGGNDGPPLEEAKANGRLIAAAPDMLAALKDAALQLQYLADKFIKTGTGETTLTRVNAAIEKATNGN